MVPGEHDKLCQTAKGLPHSPSHLHQPPQFALRSPIHTHTPTLGPRNKAMFKRVFLNANLIFFMKWMFVCFYLIKVQVSGQQRDFSLSLDRKQRGSLDLLHTRAG